MSSLPTTNAHMIFRLANTEDQQAWDEFINIYTPLLNQTARRLGLSSHDASDAVQEVLVHLISVISKWRPDGQSASFRRWIAKVARHRMIRMLQRKDALRFKGMAEQDRSFFLAQLAAPDQSKVTFDLAFRKQVFRFVADRIQGEFKVKTWQAFWLTYVQQQPIAEVAGQLSLSVGAVYIARSRVMNRLREMVERLMDDDWELLADAINEERSDFN